MTIVIFFLILIVIIQLISLSLLLRKETKQIPNVSAQNNNSSLTGKANALKVSDLVTVPIAKDQSENDTISLNRERVLTAKELEQQFFQIKIAERFPTLSNKDQFFCYLMWQSFPLDKIARMARLSLGSTKVYRHRIKQKLGVENSRDVAAFLSKELEMSPIHQSN